MKEKGYVNSSLYMDYTFFLWCSLCLEQMQVFVYDRNCNPLFTTGMMQFPITAIREIKILKKLHHENVIQLKEIVTSPGLFKEHICCTELS